MSASFIWYLAGVSENISVVLLITAIILMLLSFIVYAVGGMEEYDDERKATLFKKGEMGFISAFILGLISALLPCKTTVAQMASIEVAQKVIESKKVQETTEKVLNVLNKKLDDSMKEGTK